MARPEKRFRGEESAKPFSINFKYDATSVVPRPVSATLICFPKNWEWNLYRRDVGTFQGLSQSLQKIPGKLLEDGDRFRPDGNPELPKTASALDGVKDQLELWWKETHRMEAAQQLGTGDYHDLISGKTRASQRKYVVFNTDIATDARTTVDEPTAAWSTGSTSSSLSSGSSVSGERADEFHLRKGMSESLGEFLSLLTEYQRVFSTATDHEHCKIAAQVLDEAGWLSVACMVYLRFFTPLWLKTQTTSCMISEVVQSELKPAVAVLEAEWRRFQLPRFQHHQSPPPSPPNQAGGIFRECVTE